MMLSKDATMTHSHKPDPDRRYSSDEVADIIRLSLQDESRRSGDALLDYDELIAIAKDVGVNSEQIDRAVFMLQEEQQTREKERGLWQQFKGHVMVFAGVNLLLIAINLISGSDTLWALYSIFGWGLFLLGHYAGLRYAPQFVEMATQRTRNMMDMGEFSDVDGDEQVLFSTSDSLGMTDTSGIIRLDDGKLIVEYQTIDAILGLVKSSVKTLEIPLSKLSSVRIEQKLWSADLVLQGKTMGVLNSVPGSSRGQLRVKLNRQSVNAAKMLVSSTAQQPARQV
jgi:transposase-like protein